VKENKLNSRWHFDNIEPVDFVDYNLGKELMKEILQIGLK